VLSIITPVLNGERFIEDNIRSIKKLSIPYEHIIVDGSSTDGTIKIVSKFNDVLLLKQKANTGMYGAIAQGIEHSKGKVLCYINADDQIIVEGFERMYNTIVNEPIDLIYSDSLFNFTEHGRFVQRPAVPFGKLFLKSGIMPFVQPSSMYTRELYFKVGGFNFERFRICGDLDLFQKMAFNPNSRFKKLKVTSSIFLKHNESLAVRNLSRHIEEHRLLKPGPLTCGVVKLFHYLVFTIQKHTNSII